MKQIVLNRNGHQLTITITPEGHAELVSAIKRDTAQAYGREKLDQARYNAALDGMESTLLAFAKAAYLRRLFALGNAALIEQAMEEAMATAMDAITNEHG